MKKIELLLLALIIGLCGAHAQNYHKLIEGAQKHLQQGNYEKAQILYNIYVNMTGQTSDDFETLLKNNKQNLPKQEGYIDLGLPSGTKWSSQNESQRYSFDAALKTYSLSTLPSAEQWNELSDYCNWEWYECDGIYGYILTSKINGNSIFLPADFPYWEFHVKDQRFENETSASSLEIYSDGAFFRGCVVSRNEWYSVRLVVPGGTPYLSSAEKHFSNQPADEETLNIPVGNVQIQMKHVEGGNFKGRVPDLGVDCQRATAKEWELYDLSVNDYYIATTEVTQALWQAVMGETFSEFLYRLSSQINYLNGDDLTVYGIGDNNPVYYVSSDDVKEFIMRLNLLTGKNFRLPTTREWIFAECGGNKSLGFKYSGSNYIDRVAWYESNSNGKTHPVASKLPNELGLYDFSGNVMEWTQCDYWDTTIYGSGYVNPEDGCLLGDNWRAKGHFRGVGFRLAMDYTPCY